MGSAQRTGVDPIVTIGEGGLKGGLWTMPPAQLNWLVLPDVNRHGAACRARFDSVVEHDWQPDRSRTIILRTEWWMGRLLDNANCGRIPPVMPGLEVYLKACVVQVARTSSLSGGGPRLRYSTHPSRRKPL